MTWSYSLSTLATTPKDQVRRLIGDTVTTDQQLQDEEVNLALALYGSSTYGAAAECCRYLAATYARQVDTVAAELRTLYSARIRNYRQLAMDYATRAGIGGAVAYAGGISVLDKQNQEADSDRVTPNFNIGMQDNTLPIGPVGNESSVNPEPPTSF